MRGGPRRASAWACLPSATRPTVPASARSDSRRSISRMYSTCLFCHSALGANETLETAWADAERVASIADNLFLPEAITSWMRRHV